MVPFRMQLMPASLPGDPRIVPLYAAGVSKQAAVQEAVLVGGERAD